MINYKLRRALVSKTSNCETKVLNGVVSVDSKLDVALPDIDYIEIPVSWWDAEADKSLLIGVHKHGEFYFSYNYLKRTRVTSLLDLSVQHS